jgi:hypothetical protein
MWLSGRVTALTLGCFRWEPLISAARSRHGQKWFSHYLRNRIGMSNPDRVFHSIRHSFQDALRRATPDDELRCIIVAFVSAMLHLSHECGTAVFFVITLVFFLLALIDLAREIRIGPSDLDHHV